MTTPIQDLIYNALCCYQERLKDTIGDMSADAEDVKFAEAALNLSHQVNDNFSEHLEVVSAKVYGIKDTFHAWLTEAPEVTSAEFENVEAFFSWCRQHSADNEWYEIK